VNDPYEGGVSERWWTWPFWFIAGIGVLIIVGILFIIKGIWWIGKKGDGAKQ